MLKVLQYYRFQFIIFTRGISKWRRVESEGRRACGWVAGLLGTGYWVLGTGYWVLKYVLKTCSVGLRAWGWVTGLLGAGLLVT
ncbi:MAG: hypothetical protein AAF693_20900 [Bacteroidota bacterium]